MQDINYKQEFPLLESFYYKDEKGDIVPFGFPPYDFTLRYWTTSPKEGYEAKVKYLKDDITYINCHRIGDKLLVMFDRHMLNPGELKAEMIMDVPDELYPDGKRRDRFVLDTNVRLVTGPTASPSMAESQLILPYIKGKDFSYDDLTDEQKKELAEQIGGSILEEAKQNTEEFFDTLPEYDVEDILDALKEMEEFKDIKPEDITT